MHEIQVVDYVFDESEFDVSRYTDVLFGDTGEVAYVTNRFDGAVYAFSLTPTTMSLADTSPHLSVPRVGAEPSLALLNSGVLSGGWIGGQLVLRETLGSGFGSETTLGPGSVFPAELVDVAVTDLTDGGSLVLAGLAGREGLAALKLTSGAEVASAEIIGDTATSFLSHVRAVDFSLVDGDRMAATACAIEDGVTLWSVSSSGELTEKASVGSGNGFWANGPADLEFAAVDGQSFIVVASSESSSLSVLEVFSDGSLAIRDHIIDNRDSRFANATEVNVVEHGGRVYVFASGSDDGLSAFVLSATGRLIQAATVADTLETGLANISAIDGKSGADGIDLLATSSTEVGLTRLRLQTGAIGSTIVADEAGDTLTGSQNADNLNGGDGSDTLIGLAGDDILFDGRGKDQMIGGDGRDVFVLSSDNEFDRITDFTLGDDKVDLSGWSGLRSLNQLFAVSLPDGIRISYGQEVLDIESFNGQPLDLSDFEGGDLLGPTRLPDTITPGFSGPIISPPALPERDTYVPPVQPPPPEEGGLEILGTASSDTLFGSDLGDSIFGLSSDDTLYGQAGSDIINGGSGSDRLDGGEGDDIIYGGTGRSLDWALASDSSSGQDILTGGSGNDILFGQSGADRLIGGIGDDLLNGGGGRDVFLFESGRDTVLDFGLGVDRLELDQDLFAPGATAASVFETYASQAATGVTFDFGNGDLLVLLGVEVSDALASSIDLI